MQRVVKEGGCVVRVGIDLDSAVVAELAEGTQVEVVQSCETATGKPRLRLSNPAGYTSPKFLTEFVAPPPAPKSSKVTVMLRLPIEGKKPHALKVKLPEKTTADKLLAAFVKSYNAKHTAPEEALAADALELVISADALSAVTSVAQAMAVQGINHIGVDETLELQVRRVCAAAPVPPPPPHTTAAGTGGGGGGDNESTRVERAEARRARAEASYQTRKSHHDSLEESRGERVQALIRSEQICVSGAKGGVMVATTGNSTCLAVPSKSHRYANVEQCDTAGGKSYGNTSGVGSTLYESELVNKCGSFQKWGGEGDAHGEADTRKTNWLETRDAWAHCGDESGAVTRRPTDPKMLAAAKGKRVTDLGGIDVSTTTGCASTQALDALGARAPF